MVTGSWLIFDSDGKHVRANATQITSGVDCFFEVQCLEELADWFAALKAMT